MSDTKWADVAHYYSKSHIEVVSLRGSNPKTGQLMGMYQSDAVTVMFGKNQNVDKRKFSVVQLEWCKPILLHFEDMTEDEDNECMLVHTRWVEDSDLRRVIWSLAKQHKTFDQHSTHWLISRGFDVFGLIESGQAIRKEAGNGNS